MDTNYQKSRAEPLTTGKIKTESILFQCDKHINRGMLLRVDVMYITRYRRLRDVFPIGPNTWFNSSEYAGIIRRQGEQSTSDQWYFYCCSLGNPAKENYIKCLFSQTLN